MSTPCFGMDVLLTQKGTAIEPGESIRFTLVKGPTNSDQKDPLYPKASPETFPQILKFTESVVKPDFVKAPWTKGRLYQQDTPKAQDDSDEEVTTNPRKKRWRRHEVPRRQWVMQEETDFLETMMAKRQKKILPSDRVSTRYEGVAEHNPSTYVILNATKDANTLDQISITLLPTNAHNSFAQPAKLQTLSMTEAEQAIQDQRGKMTRFMMHRNNTGSAIQANPNAATSGAAQSRLMGKLQTKGTGGDDPEDDDVMGDVGYKARKGGGSKARKELLTTLGDAGLAVDDDGVLGGTNDAEFGGKRHFGKFNVGEREKTEASGSSKENNAGNDGMAMADDFYQRDVKAEYEELDYDANEQFDDDDVDLGETDMVMDNMGGFAADDEDEDEDYEDEERDGAEGLATVAGFRALLAKARGETVVAADEGAASDGERKNGDTKKSGEESRPASPNQAATGTSKMEEQGVDSLASILAAAESAAQIAKQKSAGDKPATGVELDENGERLVTLKAVQREIWLQNGSIRTKRLMKIFNIKTKTSRERKSKFQAVIKELCTMQVDPVEGNMMVLKQHYSSMK